MATTNGTIFPALRRLATLTALLALATPLAAQQDTTRLPPGVELESRYTKLNRPLIAVRPFAGPMGGDAQTIAQIGEILRNDLELSDRFEMFPVTAELAASNGIDYAVWNSLNIVYLITGDVMPTASGFDLLLTAHDVVYGRERQAGSFSIPPASDPDFRMAVHAAADAVVRWLTGQPGMAATRIAFTRMNEGSFDLMIVDSDGHNARRLFGSERQVYSPAFSPDGSKIAYTESVEEGTWRLVERDIASGRNRTIASGALVSAPAYSPDGTKLFFGMYVPGRGAQGGSEIHVYDFASGQTRRITESINANMLPTISPDGRKMAYMTTRTGRQHIYVSDTDGSNARLLTPIGERVQFNGPAWSPTDGRVAFHGQSRSSFQIMIADGNRPGGPVVQLTSSGDNQDPSWAPDGRHIVYTGAGAQGEGLYVIDTVTGTIRLLYRGRRLRMPDWSPSLAGAVSASH